MRIAIPLAILIAFGRQTIQVFKLYNQDVDALETAQADTWRYINDYATAHAKNVSDVRVLWTYGAWSPVNSIWMGNYFSNNVFADEAVKLYPSERLLDVWSGSVYDAPKPVPFDYKTSQWDVIVTVDWFVDSGYDYLKSYGTSVSLSNGRIVIVRNGDGT
jgi:hypothetical protein